MASSAGGRRAEDGRCHPAAVRGPGAGSPGSHSSRAAQAAHLLRRALRVARAVARPEHPGRRRRRGAAVRARAPLRRGGLPRLDDLPRLRPAQPGPGRRRHRLQVVPRERRHPGVPLPASAPHRHVARAARSRCRRVLPALERDVDRRHRRVLPAPRQARDLCRRFRPRLRDRPGADRAWPRPLALPPRPRAGRPHRGAEPLPGRELPPQPPAHTGADPELLRAARARAARERAERQRPLGRHDPRLQAPRDVPRDRRAAAAPALRHDRRPEHRRRKAEARVLRGDPRPRRPAAERRIHRLPAACRGRALLRPRAAPGSHVRVRGHAQRLPAGLGARRADGLDRRGRRAGQHHHHRCRASGSQGRSVSGQHRAVEPGVGRQPGVLPAQPFQFRGARALRAPAGRAGAVNGATKAIAAQGLARRAFSLGAVKAFDHALQFLLPVVLVRCLDGATFGEYRLVWLAVGTVMALATLGMPGALYYFLPRSDAPTRRLYIHQTLAFLVVTGLAAAFIVSPLNPWMPATLHPLAKYGAQVPAFVMLWVVAVLLDFLPTIEERIPLQAYATISVAVARALLVAGGAWFTADMSVILWLLLATVLLKLALLLAYIGRFHGWGRPWFKPAVFGGQIRYTAPFGFSSACYILRSQADQWV